MTTRVGAVGLALLLSLAGCSNVLGIDDGIAYTVDGGPAIAASQRPDERDASEAADGSRADGTPDVVGAARDAPSPQDGNAAEGAAPEADTDAGIDPGTDASEDVVPSNDAGFVCPVTFPDGGASCGPGYRVNSIGDACLEQNGTLVALVMGATGYCSPHSCVSCSTCDFGPLCTAAFGAGSTLLGCSDPGGVVTINCGP